MGGATNRGAREVRCELLLPPGAERDQTRALCPTISQAPKRGRLRRELPESPAVQVWDLPPSVATSARP
jgi:hypothetical protein